VTGLDEGLERALRGMKAVLHAAGPFSQTFRPMVDACLRTGTHYIDVSGELPTFEALFARDAEAQERKVMLLPGAGFDVVPTDCLSLHLARRVRNPRKLIIGISGLDLISRGSLRTLLNSSAGPCSLSSFWRSASPCAPFASSRNSSAIPLAVSNAGDENPKSVPCVSSAIRFSSDLAPGTFNGIGKM